MKICKCLCSCVLSVIMLVSLLVPVSATTNERAGNYQNIPFINFDIWVDGRRLDASRKLDSTPHYFYVREGNIDAMHIRSYGNTYDFSNGGTNCTYANGSLVNYVTCRKGTEYKVRNLVNESGYSWTALAIARKDSPAGGWVSGYWSPDSIGTNYTVATP